MPGLKTILAVVPDTGTGLATMETALVVGRDHNCHVRVLHVRPDPASAVPLVGEAMSGAMVDEMMSVCERQGTERARDVRQMFDQVCGRYAIPVTDEPPGPPEMSVAFLEEQGVEDDKVALRGRMADLIVVGRPKGDEEPALQATLNAALMDSGRPVLVAPRNPVTGIAKNCAIAWNGSAEAARAVAAALPFLIKARTVTILVADEEEGTPSAQDLENHLAWHGVTAEIRRVVPSGSAVGAALLKACNDVSADLLVMGAYTHSRLRQLILGGVTRHVLDHAEVPVLLSH
ncbi:MAG: universal stress protein UspA [Rhodospirillaceae bacterium BRH_c57]|nr:MAG: universal stress protein UspA [Rhodospirillaceae bacterium BRH_c57]